MYRTVFPCYLFYFSTSVFPCYLFYFYIISPMLSILKNCHLRHFFTNKIISTHKPKKVREKKLHIFPPSDHKYISINWEKTTNNPLDRIPVMPFCIFSDLSTATTKYLGLWRPASAFKIYSKGFKSNGEAL